jgi:hypothetical protein
MCAIAYCISVTNGLCEVHKKYPTLQPPEVGFPTPAKECTEKEAEYILQACGTPPEEELDDQESGDEDEDSSDEDDEDDDNED